MIFRAKVAELIFSKEKKIQTIGYQKLRESDMMIFFLKLTEISLETTDSSQGQ